MKTMFLHGLTVLILTFSFSIAQTATAPSGDGSIGSPYQIATWQNLYWISQNSGEWSKHYVQTTNIDFADASPAINTWSIGAGWTPIGNASINFTGTYNGQSHTINGIYINRTTADNIGFFGYLNGASISNLGIVDGSVTGQNYVGGLVGSVYGGSSITYCYNSISVSGSSQVGGLAGNNDNGTISKCYNTGTIGNGIVTTSGASYVGGLAGHNNRGNINNSYSTGTINGGYWGVGGLVGYNNTNGGTVQKCYSTGQVIAYPDPAGGYYRFGGLVGDCCSGPVYDSYWDTQTSGTSLSPSGKGTGKTTEQMKTQSTFSGWDFSATWEIVGGDGANYPRLQGNPDPALPVELTSFTVSSKNGAAVLKWATASERNNYGFEIEKLLNFNISKFQNSEWEKIGFVEGNGTSSTSHEYSFTDHSMSAGKYLFRLKQIDRDGAFSYSHTVEVSVAGTPLQFMLQQNYPNPFNPVTELSFSVGETGLAALTIVNMLGQEVAVPFHGVAQAGTFHHVSFNASMLPSGTYFAKLTSRDKIHVTKILLMK